MSTHVTTSSLETIALGKTFAATLRPGDVVTLTGNLGSGKTQFVIGVCEGLQAAGHIASPTFTLIHEYNASFGKVVHVDLYRINKPQELDELGIQEYYNDECICLIEWPEIAESILPAKRIDVAIEYGEGETERRISIREAVHA